MIEGSIDSTGLSTVTVHKKTHIRGESSLVSYYSEQGFKDIGPALVFGHLDIKNDLDFKNLTDDLTAYAKSLGLSQIVGPLNKSTFFEYRIKMNHFNEAAYIGEPVTNSNLLGSFQQNGYKILKRYFSYEFVVNTISLSFWLGLIGRLAGISMRSRGYKIKPLLPDDLVGLHKDIHQIIHEIFHANYLYSAISDEQFLNLVKKLYLESLDSDSSLLLLSPDGKCVGFNLCLVDFTNKDRVLFKAHGVKKAHRQKGLSSLWLMARARQAILKKYRFCLACLTIEGSRIDSHFSKRAIKRYEYGLFTKVF